MASRNVITLRDALTAHSQRLPDGHALLLEAKALAEELLDNTANSASLSLDPRPNVTRRFPERRRSPGGQ